MEQEKLKLKYIKLTSVAVVFVFWLAARGLFYLRGETYRLLIPYESIFTETVNSARENVVYDIHPN